MSKNELIWSGPKEIEIRDTEPSIDGIKSLVSFANNKNLTEKQQSKLVNAFKIAAYDMGAEYAWRCTMSILKDEIASLGMKFVGEMLDRKDINDFSLPDVVLTDNTAINLADQLGIVNRTGALKLRQALELLNHYFSKNRDEDLDMFDAMNIVAQCVKYVLGQKHVRIAIEFSNFRERLQSETLSQTDPQLQTLLSGAIFYIKTIVNVLLGNITSEKGATMEHSMANLNVILPVAWERLEEKDKWNVGMTYRDVVTEGNEKAAIGMKKALMKVKGFDFVPESLRSNTFKRAAQIVIDTHFNFNNFYNEAAVVKALSKLGSTIPAPALQECMEAYLLVYIGNIYGIAYDAAPIAEEELLNIPADSWEHFFNKIFPKDELLLTNIQGLDQFRRFSKLINNLGEDKFSDLDPGNIKQLYAALKEQNYINYKSVIRKFLEQLEF